MDFWTFYWGFVAFVFGAIVGSFLNVCIWRLPRGESLSDPPSHCPACQHRLRFFPDMVPLFSQLWFRSRCRYCGQRFSWRYFWVELTTALLFTALYVRYAVHAPSGLGETEVTVSAICAMLFSAALVTIFFIDLEHYEIPDAAVAVAVLAAVARDIVLIRAGIRPLWQEIPGTPWTVPLPLSVLGAVLAFWALWQFAAVMTALLGKEAMGAGDSLLLAAMGAFLIPWPLVLLAFLIAVALGTVGGLATASMGSREQAGTEGEAPVSGDASAETAPAPPEPAAPFAEQAGEGAPSTPANELVGMESGGPRGAAAVPGGADEEPEIPRLPPASRWGRLLTVLGTWVAVGGLWFGASLFSGSAAAGVGAGLAGLLVAAGLLFVGIRMWLTGDREWLPAMDALFEDGDPGPRFIPFGPYLVAGTLLAMLWGRTLLDLYVSSQLSIWITNLRALPWD